MGRRKWLVFVMDRLCVFRDVLSEMLNAVQGISGLQSAEGHSLSHVISHQSQVTLLRVFSYWCVGALSFVHALCRDVKPLGPGTSKHHRDYRLQNGSGSVTNHTQLLHVIQRITALLAPIKKGCYDQGNQHSHRAICCSLSKHRAVVAFYRMCCMHTFLATLKR